MDGKLRRGLTLLAILLLLVGGCTAPKANNVTLTISAAASLNDALQEIGELYKKEKPGVEILYNFASSGVLQQQIEKGAPADLYISASPVQMNALQQKGLLIEESRQDLLQNKIILIAPQGSDLKDFTELCQAKVTKVAIGAPDSVPAGKYAKDIFISLGLWDRIEPKLILAKDVRQVLAYVESGDVEAGMVYRTDLNSTSSATIVCEAPAESYNPVVYPLAVLQGSKSQQEAGELTQFLSSEQAEQVFRRFGFTFAGK